MSELKRALTEGASPPPEKKKRLPKRKVALRIGYCGTGYHGMQLNDPHKTIESELFGALCRAGAISESNADDLRKSSFQRAARTDKGVHAACNVVSLKMIIESENILEAINAELPEQLRVWGFTRVNQGFGSHRSCSSRVYEYVLPTYSLAEAPKDVPENVSEDSENVSEQTSEKTETSEPSKAETSKTEKSNDEEEEDRFEVPEVSSEKYAKVAQYRITPDRLEKFRAALKEYEGTHNFHNFTVGKPFKDPSAMRVMKSLTVSDPFVINGTEWVSVKIHGQSFMLHQIRKMIALAVLIVRHDVSIDRIKELYGPKKVPIPKAPSLGLLLERPRYDAYNKRLQQIGHPPIEQADEEVEAFKHRFIYSRIYEQEAEDKTFYAFFLSMDGSQQRKELLNQLEVKPKAVEESKESESKESESKESEVKEETAKTETPAPEASTEPERKE